MDGGYVEYCVKKKREGKLMIISLLYYAFFILAPLICLILLLFVGHPELLLGGAAAVCGIFGFGAYLTHRFISFEYEYVIVGGEMTVDIIYGGKSRKTVTEIDLKDVRLCLPCTEENKDAICAAEYEKLYDISSSKDSDSAYFLLWEEEGKKKALLFDTNEKAREMLKRYIRVRF